MKKLYKIDRRTVKRSSQPFSLAFFRRSCYNRFMEKAYLKALDEYFCAQYSDYVKISALEGYKMPEVLYVGADGNIGRRDSSVMRLSRQENAEELLKTFKQNLADTDFTFNFSFRPIGDKLRDPFRKYTFAKILPAALKRCGESAKSAGEKLAIDPAIWKKIVKGKLYPEKNVVLALALVCRMQERDVNNLLAVCGFTLSDESVRDVVVGYLLKQGIHNEEMRDGCLAEYKITSLPLKKGA